MKPTKLYRTTIVIWSEKEPPPVIPSETGEMGSDDTLGKAYCNVTIDAVEDQAQMPKTDYFDIPTND